MFLRRAAVSSCALIAYPARRVDRRAASSPLGSSQYALALTRIPRAASITFVVAAGRIKPASSVSRRSVPTAGGVFLRISGYRFAPPEPRKDQPAGLLNEDGRAPQGVGASPLRDFHWDVAGSVVVVFSEP